MAFSEYMNFSKLEKQWKLRKHSYISGQIEDSFSIIKCTSWSQETHLSSPKTAFRYILHIFSCLLTIYIPCNFPYNNKESFSCLLQREHSSCRQFIMYEKCGYSMVNDFIFKNSIKNYYRTHAIITRSWFETALDYKPRIFLKNFLV